LPFTQRQSTREQHTQTRFVAITTCVMMHKISPRN